jgi:hypothetical protein
VVDKVSQARIIRFRPTVKKFHPVIGQRLLGTWMLSHMVSHQLTNLGSNPWMQFGTAIKSVWESSQKQIRIQAYTGELKKFLQSQEP